MELRHDYRSPASSSSSSSRQPFNGGSSYSHIDMLEKEAAEYEKYVLTRADNISRTYERISKGFNAIRSSPRREDPPVQTNLSSSISSFKSSFRSSFAPPPPLVNLGSSGSASAVSSSLPSPLNTSVNNAYNVRDAYKDITRTNSVEKKLRDGGFSVSRSRSPSPSPVRSVRSISLRSTASSPSASPRSSSRVLTSHRSPSRSPSHSTFRASPLRSPRRADLRTTQTHSSSPTTTTTTNTVTNTAAEASANFSDWYMEDLKLQMETLRRHNVDLATSLKCREEEVFALRDKYKAQQQTIEELQLTQEVNEATREGLLKPASAYESIQAKTIENLYGDIARLEAEKIEMQLSMDDLSRRLQNKEQEYRVLQQQLNQVKGDLKQERDRYTRLLQSQQQNDFKSSNTDDSILDSYLGTTKQKLDSAFNSTTTSPVRNQPSRSSRTPSSDDTWTRALPKEPYPNVSLSALDSVTQDFIASKIDEQSLLHKDDFSFEESAILKEAERKAREDAIFESEDPFFTSLRFHVARSAMKQTAQRSPQTAQTALVDTDADSYRYSLQTDVENISWGNGTDSYVRSELNQSLNHTPNDSGSKYKAEREILNDIQEVVNGLRAAKTPNEKDARYKEGLAQLRQSFQSTQAGSS
eukprot:GILK01005517.1.p1 GENE.GILK01005517.1~~GILK01005517.1.p1  ORF type:complete len:659 (+),score=141.62 GILK01005517.1:55-1977(+)